MDSARPEELAAWWGGVVGADVRPGPDGTLRWLHGPAGWPDLIWKFVRVADERTVVNRWRWSVRGDRDALLTAGALFEGVWRDPQGNEFVA